MPGGALATAATRRYKRAMTRRRALLATLRIANAPSVAGNVWTGFLVAWLFWFGNWISMDTEMIGWRSPGLTILAGLLLYFSGNLANDWYDREWDRLRRPERALPSGMFHPMAFLVAAVACAVAGTALAFLRNAACGGCALFIVASISIYTWLHKRTPWAVIPMGLCRAGLYFLGFFSLWPGLRLLRESELDVIGPLAGTIALTATLALGLMSYIAGLSLSARCESMADTPPGHRVLSKALLVFPVIAMSCWFMAERPGFGWIGIPPYLLWLRLCFTRYRKSVSSHVSALLAGIPLVDLIATAPIALSIAVEPRQGVVNVPFAIIIAAVPFLAFVLGRLLQRVAPAT